jgi:glycosyltransferase involved in cell wall biosynthesis
MINVLVIPELTARRTPTPCASIRLFLPLTKETVMRAMNVTFAPIENIGFRRAELVIAHSISLTSVEDVATVERYCRRNNAKFAYDLDDDLLALGSDHTQSDVYEGFKPAVRKALESADQIWTSTEVLAERCRQYGPDVVTIPNALDRRIWSPPIARPIDSRVTRFLYMDMQTHREGLSTIVLPAFSRLERELGDKVSLTVIGVTDRADPAARFSILNAPPNIALSYPAFVNWLQSQGPFDVGLAPLIDTIFNRGKSNIKQLEYAALGLPTIASDLPPYRDTPCAARGVVLVEPTVEGFCRAMYSMVRERNKREKLQLAARHLADELLGPDADQEPRIQVIQKLIENASRPRAAFMTTAGSQRRRARLKGVLTHLLTSDLRDAEAFIKTSGLFDAAWYLRTYPDVAAAGVEPLVHYLTEGGREQRNPSLAFDTSAYLMFHPDVASRGMNALLHYVKYGRKEGRVIRPVVEQRSEEYMPAAVDSGPIKQTERCIAFYSCKAQNNFDLGGTPAAFHTAERSVAKRFGLAGFCYHVDLTEGGMLDDLLWLARDTDDDFSFCLSLGRDLVATHSASLIERIAPLLQSRNYLRVDGHPILVILHAAQGADTSPHHLRAQWRTLMPNQADLLIVGKHQAPAELRLLEVDAVLEVPEASHEYRDLVRKSYDIASPTYPTFRLVRLGNSSPAAYQEWLENACRFARENRVANTGIVFIDGWNGAELENELQPTPRFGYAYLNATAKALQSVEPSVRPLALGVIAHVYYEDVWPEIAARLRRWDVPFRLYATVPEGKEETVSALIHSEWPNAIVTGVPNRGRDIAPFLQQARLAEQDGVDVICKVHTKKSRHRPDGEQWRRDLYDKLLGDAALPAAVTTAFAANAALGIIAPKGHLIAGEFFWGANATRVHELAERLGYVGPLDPFTFAAGSMFWIRSRALKPILDLALKTIDFEPELRQVDGTLAHALERLLPVAAKMGGYRLTDTRVLGGSPRALDHLRSENELAYLNERRRNYQFAPAVGHPLI